MAETTAVAAVAEAEAAVITAVVVVAEAEAAETHNPTRAHIKIPQSSGGIFISIISFRKYNYLLFALPTTVRRYP